MPKLSQKQKQLLQSLVSDAKIAIKIIRDTQAFSQVEYSPDLTLGDAVTALEYLEWELGDEAQSR